MHSKLLGLAKPNQLSMPRPAGECPRAVNCEPQAGRVALRNGEKNSRKRTPGVYLGDRRQNDRPRVAAGSATHQGREALGDRPEKKRKKSRRRRRRRTIRTKAGRAKEDPRKAQEPSAAQGSTGLERVVDSDDRKWRRRAENGRGPAPEVSCSPPAEQPRPPFASQRETYRLELRGSCGRVQAIIINYKAIILLLRRAHSKATPASSTAYVTLSRT